MQDTLSQQGSLESWAEWLEGVADRVLGGVAQDKFDQAAKQFLLRLESTNRKLSKLTYQQQCD